jgi:5'-nucleotidase/UDP-sugar diphosphatase
MNPTRHVASITAMVMLGLSCAGPRATKATDQNASTPSNPIPERTAAAEESAPPAKIADGTKVLGSCADRGKIGKLSFAHFNDLQARYDENVGGKNRYGLIAGYLRAQKDSDPTTLVLDAGDDYEKGALAELRSMGESTRQMVQALPIDVRTIGNHDFAYGEHAVVRDVTMSAHPVLAANLSYPPNPSLFHSYAQFQAGCVKVGVVGLVTQGYGANDQPNDEPFAGVFAQDPNYESVLAHEIELHRADVDVMIALTHLGIGVDMNLLARVPGVDLVIGGHSEDLLKHPGWVARPDGTHGFVLQAGHYGTTLGRGTLNIDFETHAMSFDNYKIVDVDEKLPYASDVGDLAARLERENVPDSHRPIAIASADVPQGKGTADLVWRAVSDRWGADAMILGKDLFWDKLHAGPVTLQHLYDLVLVQREPSGTPGFSSLYVAEMRGDEIKKLHESMIQGPMYAFYGPDHFDPNRSYRVVLEKRALEVPKIAFSGSPDMPRARFGGELIDVLETYARSRTAKGLTLD